MAEENYETRFDNVLSSTNVKTPCAFCVEETSKYTCPRCNLCYCSTACYKSEKHLQCSENFYKGYSGDRCTWKFPLHRTRKEFWRLLMTKRCQNVFRSFLPPSLFIARAPSHTGNESCTQTSLLAKWGRGSVSLGVQTKRKWSIPTFSEQAQLLKSGN